MKIPRPEYPRPQLKRSQFINLNGEWEFAFDHAMCGKEKAYFNEEVFTHKIIVPFCPESELSGLGYTEFMRCVWYRKMVDLPAMQPGERLLLHFGAVDYLATVYVNGQEVGSHAGGYTPFVFDITSYVTAGENKIVLCAEDDVRNLSQPSGKQSLSLHSKGCNYTRTTGIWQTVWMEYVSDCYVESMQIDTDIDTPCVHMRVQLSKNGTGSHVAARVLFNGTLVGEAEVTAFSDMVLLSVPLSEKHLWGVGDPNLYDVELEVSRDGVQKDSVQSYFGLRNVAIKDGAFLLNGEKLFGRWVLDQGYYPDGIYTAPTEEAIKKDILYGMQLGFNGARLHEKIFEPQYLYWADKLGYLVWGEYPNWGLQHGNPMNVYAVLPEWIEALQRDYNHPSIIGWCPFNETSDIEGKRQHDGLIGMVYEATKAMDKMRPVIDSSGWYHVKTDIFDIHSYHQDAEELQKVLNGLEENAGQLPLIQGRQQYKGEPFFVSEYGGIRWDAEGTENAGWGYGKAPKTGEEFIARYEALTNTLLKDKRSMGFCYTQLYDIEQEINGLMTYNRQFKFDPAIFRSINTRKAEIEK